MNEAMAEQVTRPVGCNAAVLTCLACGLVTASGRDSVLAGTPLSMVSAVPTCRLVRNRLFQRLIAAVVLRTSASFPSGGHERSG